MMRRALLTVAAAALVLSLCRCSRPTETEVFIKAADAVGGVYSFDLPLEDSLSTYDVSFYTRVDAPAGRRSGGSLELNVLWVSPSGERAGETVHMDTAKLLETYRTGVSPLEPGVWTLKVKVKDPPEGLRGLGVVCKENGTR